jgi:hypothetical protein
MEIAFAQAGMGIKAASAPAATCRALRTTARQVEKEMANRCGGIDRLSG